MYVDFKYTLNSEDEEPIMLIDKHIGFDEKDGYGIMGDQFQKELLFLDSLGKKRVKVYINSTGGGVLEAMNIYNSILKSNCMVDTYCVGVCASSAAVIFQAGRTRYMADYGILMFHNPSGGDNQDAIDMLKNSLCTMISTRSGKTVDEVGAILDKTTWADASDALDNGFCDKIESSAEQNKKRLKSMNDVSMIWKEASLIVNKLTEPTKTPIEMKKVTNKLSLNEAATEDAIVTAIQEIENKSAAFKARVTELEGDKTTLSNELTTVKNKVTELEGTIATAKTATDAAKLETIKNKAEVLVKEAAKVGKIKNDATTIAAWVDKVKSEEDYTSTKALIDSIPLNVKSKDITEVVDNENDKKLGSVVSNTMNEIRNKLKI